MDAVSFYRVAAKLHRRGARRAAKLVKAASFFLFKASIPAELEAGTDFTVGHHGFGIVIHERTVLGDRVHINHNVTLATDIHPRDPRRMIVGSKVRIGTGSVLVGPITIGDRVVIAAGSVVVRDVPSDVTVAGVPARVVKEGGYALPGEVE